MYVCVVLFIVLSCVNACIKLVCSLFVWCVHLRSAGRSTQSSHSILVTRFIDSVLTLCCKSIICKQFHMSIVLCALCTHSIYQSCDSEIQQPVLANNIYWKLYGRRLPLSSEWFPLCLPPLLPLMCGYVQVEKLIPTLSLHSVSRSFWGHDNFLTVIARLSVYRLICG